MSSLSLLKTTLGLRLGSRKGVDGFTIVELLVAISLGGIVIAALASIAVTHISLGRRMISAQTLDDARSRVAFAIEADVSEGRLVEASSAQVGCSSEGQKFAILAPWLNEGTGVVQEVYIVYSNAENGISRCGPPVSSRGALQFSSAVEEVRFMEGASIENVSINSTGTVVSFDLVLLKTSLSPARAYAMSFGTKSYRIGA